MPVRQGKTTRKGEAVHFYRWGSKGKKYEFRVGSPRSRTLARHKAEKQGRAARAAGYVGGAKRSRRTSRKSRKSRRSRRSRN